MPQQTQKLFSVDEANQMLPLVSVIVRDIREAFRHYGDRKRALARSRQRAMRESDSRSSTGIRDLEIEVSEASRGLKDLVRELTELGVLIKDPMQGVVDFPFERKGRVAHLCWKFGEERIVAWHDTGEGFDARKPLGEPSTV